MAVKYRHPNKAESVEDWEVSTKYNYSAKGITEVEATDVAITATFSDKDRADSFADTVADMLRGEVDF